jgi:hypothetical protein
MAGDVGMPMPVCEGRPGIDQAICYYPKCSGLLNVEHDHAAPGSTTADEWKGIFHESALEMVGLNPVAFGAKENGSSLRSIPHTASRWESGGLLCFLYHGVPRISECENCV